MCTVTFIPSKGKLYFASNRDEKVGRTDAIAPGVYEFDSGKMLFPKDADGGGTWMAVHENGNAVVFLNGGLQAHESKPPYRKSRGLILLDLLEGATPFNGFLVIKLDNIEPFTAIIWDNCHLFECRWDGFQKHSKQLDERIPHIWSSVTLYGDEVIDKRNQWFEKWISRNQEPEVQDVLHFHQFTGDGDRQNDLRMNRNGKIFTVSVTALTIDHKQATMIYLDLKNNRETESLLSIEKSIVSR